MPGLYNGRAWRSAAFARSGAKYALFACLQPKFRYKARFAVRPGAERKVGFCRQV
jgi:hypothetical protein